MEKNNNQPNIQNKMPPLPKRPDFPNKPSLPKKPEFVETNQVEKPSLPKRPNFQGKPNMDLPKKPVFTETNQAEKAFPKKPDLPKINDLAKSDFSAKSDAVNESNLTQIPNLPKKPKLPKKPNLPKKPDFETTDFDSKPFVDDLDEKPKKPTLKSRLFWAAFVAIFITVSSMALGLYHTITINAKIGTPTGLQVYLLSNGETYVQVDGIARAEMYEFLISFNDGEPTKIRSPLNVLSVSGLINIVGEYSITCRILGLTELAHSDYCESITYLKKSKIKTPQLSLNTNENKLEFYLQDHFVENVALNFLLCYGVDDDGNLLYYENFTISTDDHLGTVYGYFSLDFLPSGEYSLSVKVEAENNELYLPSSLSNQINYTSTD